MTTPEGDIPTAPWYPVPSSSLLSVEHPCIVHNVEKAIDMLGGPKEIAKRLDSHSIGPLGLKFQPDDPASRTLLSTNKRSNNILLQFTLPKRTGRKRKRGTDGPFFEDSSQRKDAAYLIRSMNDNPQQSQPEVLGSIRSTHVWRTMPDFVYSSKGSSFLHEIRTKIVPQDYRLLQSWPVPQTHGLTDTEVIPPQVLSTQSVPFNYTYRQNPAVKTIADPLTGKKALHNNQKPPKLYTHHCHHNDERWPDRPRSDCPPLGQQPKNSQKLYDLMCRLFDERPIWSRRALINQFPDDAPIFSARNLIAYIAFAIRSGPWRDTLCKLGVDPRSDRSYRKYQSVLIQLIPRGRDKVNSQEDLGQRWTRSKDKTSHIFTGDSAISPDGRVWQLCDLQDGQLKALVDVPDIYIRHECETRYFGWYHNGTVAKIRVALKAKADARINGETFDDAALAKFMLLPEQWDGTAVLHDPMIGYLSKNSSKKELEWASAYRSLCRTANGLLPQTAGNGKGRLSKTKPSTRASFIDRGESQAWEEADTPRSYGEPEEGDDGLNEGEEDEEEHSEEPVFEVGDLAPRSEH